MDQPEIALAACTTPRREGAAGTAAPDPVGVVRGV
jgi:hypothetical protein